VTSVMKKLRNPNSERDKSRLPPQKLSGGSESARQAREREISFRTEDGWRVAGSLYIPPVQTEVPAVLFVHGSRHESDAYGNLTAPGIPQTLSSWRIATLRIDIRGRGSSREPRNFHSMAPAERARVELDVKAAIKFLVGQQRVNARCIGIVAEQDSTTPAVLASAASSEVRGLILISGRLSEAAKKSISRLTAPILCMVSKEDRRGFRDMSEAFLLSRSDKSRLRVFEGLALGTTMFSTWRNEFPNEPPIDELAGDWLADVLLQNTTSVRRRKAR